jgi:hypothetical protein
MPVINNICLCIYIHAQSQVMFRDMMICIPCLNIPEFFFVTRVCHANYFLQLKHGINFMRGTPLCQHTQQSTKPILKKHHWTRDGPKSPYVWGSPSINRINHPYKSLVGGDWNHGIWIDFPFSWECHHPN